MTRALLLSSFILTACLRAQDFPAPPDTTYSTALLAYKTGDYAAAATAISAAEAAHPDDLAIQVLKARILTQQQDYAGAEKILRTLLARDPARLETQDALGDLYLKKRDFDQAAAVYLQAVTTAPPPQPDLILKLIYADVSRDNQLEAGAYLIRLKPFSQTDPAYYFAKAAVAQAAGNFAEADEEIQTSRTLYGITLTNNYLKLFYEVFHPAKTETGPSALAPTHP